MCEIPAGIDDGDTDGDGGDHDDDDGSGGDGHHGDNEDQVERLSSSEQIYPVSGKETLNNQNDKINGDPEQSQ